MNGYRCTCTASFSGKNCEIPLNDCSAQPCKNGGTCQLGGSGFTCSCKPGYTSLTCDIDINECSSNPCQNGGTCVNNVNSYLCQCADGYRGRICEVLFAVSFQHGSYLPALTFALFPSDLFSFRFRTTLPAGLLFYQGAVGRRRTVLTFLIQSALKLSLLYLRFEYIESLFVVVTSFTLFDPGFLLTSMFN